MGGSTSFLVLKKASPNYSHSVGERGRSVELAYGPDIPLVLVWPWLRPFLPWASVSPSVKWDQWSQQYRGDVLVPLNIPHEVPGTSNTR